MENMFSKIVILFVISQTVFVRCHPNGKYYDEDLEDMKAIEEAIGQGDYYEEEEDNKVDGENIGEEDIQGAPLKKKENKRWPNGVVPYVIATEFTSTEKNNIRAALRDIKAAAPCLSFQEYRMGDTRVPNTHIHIKKTRGCWSLIGRTSSGRKQFLSLAEWCVNKRGTVIHEFLHALGFYHEQSRPDRDQYIKIYWDRLSKGGASQFRKTPRTDDLGVSYDRVSIMHYSNWAYAKRGMGKSVEWIANPDLPLGGKVLSEKDILQLNRLYCDGGVQLTTPRATVRPPVITTTTRKPRPATTSTTTKRPAPRTTTTTKKPVPRRRTTTRKPIPETTTTMRPTRPKETTTTQQPIGGACGDYHGWCIAGWCDKRKRLGCPRSCGVCRGPKSEKCVNLKNEKREEECIYMAKKGMCQTRDTGKRWNMKMNCPRACCERDELYHSPN